jgi:hypothetical protein
MRRSPAASAIALLAFALALAAPFQGCFGGGGTETEDGVVAGRVFNADGTPAGGAIVDARTIDYLGDSILSERPDSSIGSDTADAQGRYAIKGLPPGRYRFEISAAEDPFGKIRDTVVNVYRHGIDLGRDTLLPQGSITGAILPDSDSQAKGYVQVIGMNRFMVTDGLGRFKVYLPQGVYDLRLSGLQPFRRERFQYGIRVTAGEETRLDPVALEQEAKLAFSVDSVGLRILGLDTTNPVLFDNEKWDNGPDDEYIWAKASSGSLNLHGTIVTRDFHNRTLLADQMKKARQELWEARAAGLSNLPELTAGATSMLAWPSNGILDSITPIRSAGSDLIVSEAHKATPEKPLLVVVGGPLTTVAEAWLTDHSIATRMIVVGIYSYKLHPEDTVANYLVARKCRFLQWGREYVWGGTPDSSLANSIPPSLMGERLRTFLRGNTKYLPYGDIAPIAYLFRRSLWQRADVVKVSRSMEVKPASDITFDFVDIPEDANDFNGYQTEFYAGLTDPRAYHAQALPGRVEAESYTAASKASAQMIDSATGNESVAYGTGSYTEHRITSAGGAFTPKIWYRSAATAKLDIAVDGAEAVSILLTPASDWAAAVLPPVTLAAGEHVMRVTIESGASTLDWIEFVQP